MQRDNVTKISIHALREEGDWQSRKSPAGSREISIHALREEGDHSSEVLKPAAVNFYPRPPRGGRPHGGIQLCYHTKEFLSTPSARRATCGTGCGNCA